jgi:hypothetical protein
MMTLIRSCEVRAVRTCGEVTDWYRGCDRCRNEVLKWLGVIEDEYLRLSTIPSMSTVGGGGHVPGPKSPARDHVIAMLDPRSTPAGPGVDDRSDVYSIPAVIGGWCKEAWAGSEDPFPATMHEAFRYLRRRSDWHMRQDHAAVYAEEIRSLYTQLHALTEPRRKVGECPTVLYLATDDTPEVRCDAPLRAGVDDDAIRCRACGATWYRPWTDLWAAVGGQTTMDYATISEWLGVSVRTLWRWSAEDGWVRQNEGKRALWLASVALTSYQRRRDKQAS